MRTVAVITESCRRLVLLCTVTASSSLLDYFGAWCSSSGFGELGELIVVWIHRGTMEWKDSRSSSLVQNFLQFVSSEFYSSVQLLRLEI